MKLTKIKDLKQKEVDQFTTIATDRGFKFKINQSFQSPKNGKIEIVGIRTSKVPVLVRDESGQLYKMSSQDVEKHLGLELTTQGEITKKKASKTKVSKQNDTQENSPVRPSKYTTEEAEKIEAEILAELAEEEPRSLKGSEYFDKDEECQ